MTLDALDPGDDGTYPNAPRTPDGFLDVERMPIGPRWQTGPDGRPIRVDPTPTVRDRDGHLVPITAIVPPPPTTPQ